MATPAATYVAGFRAFLDLNRCVRKGERAIRILAPMSTRARDSEAGGLGDAGERSRTVFRAVSVFDVVQTDALPGTEAPLEPPSHPIEGDTHAHLLSPLEHVARELGYRISRRPVEGSASVVDEVPRDQTLGEGRL